MTTASFQPVYGSNVNGTTMVTADLGTDYPYDAQHAYLFDDTWKDNASGDAILATDPGAGYMRPNVFTQEVRFKTTTNGVVFAYSNFTYNSSLYRSSMRLDVGADGRLYYFVRSTDGTTASASQVGSLVSPTAVNDGQWHQAVTVADQSTANLGMQLYVDGQLVGQQTLPNFSWFKFDIGSQGYFRYGNDFMDPSAGYNSGLVTQVDRQCEGQMAYATSWEYALPASEVQNHWKTGTALWPYN